jgi:hypothetical protein
MNLFGVIGVFVFAIFVIQICYIYLYYQEIQQYNTKYDMFYYGVDIVPNYIDPTTSDPNDVIVTDISLKWRCVVYGNGYTIVSFNGFKVDPTTGAISSFQNKTSCMNNMFLYLNTYSSYNPCILNPSSVECGKLIQLLQ